MKVDYKKELNKEQYEAVITTEGPLLVLAGAGSGKTTVIKYRTAYLLEKGVDPESILILTFTNRAANEIRGRVVDMLGETGAYVKACTYHGFCADVLRLHSNLLSISNDFTILSAGDAEDAISLIASDIEDSSKKEFPTAKKIFDMFSKMKNTKTTLENAINEYHPEKIIYLEQINSILEKYTLYKEEHDLLDYNDLIYFTNMLFELFPSVRKNFCEKYKYKMIDEFQDTNDIQFTLLNNLCKYGNENIAVVGDPAQCIMGFQGANVENIIEFPNKFNNCKVVKLEQNYRSTQKILNMANASLEMMPSELNLKLRSSKGIPGIKPIVLEAYSMNKEAQIICNSIITSHKNGESLYNETAVLVRRSMDSFILESLLVQSGIPYKKYGGLKLMDKIYMKDILAFLKITVNPKDEIAWFRVLGLCKGVGAAISRKVTKGIVSNGVEYLIDTSHKAKYKDEYEKIYNMYKNLIGRNLKGQITYLLSKYFDLKEELIESKKISTDKRKTQLNENDHNRLEAEILYSFIDGYSNTKDFITDVTLEMPETEDEDCLTISTIHSAKGKEYNVVYYMGCIDYEQDHKNRKLEDEARRCFYVAITRAKNELYITYPRYGRKENDISQFLVESGKIISSYERRRF